jgi:2-C-methyl-D-erythritol 4-phosphate cytidylyltransferase / 2-C-methyl-D-erythritol 2,4-cyclodiphosphate synthase
MTRAASERTLALIPLPAASASRGGLRLTIQGRSVLDWTVDAMRQVPEISDLMIAEPAATRLLTLQQALQTAPPSGRVLVHEPNRPLTSAAGLRSFIQAASAHPAAAMVAAVKSTYKEVVDGRVRSTMPRNQLFQLQHVLAVDRVPFEAAVSTALQQGWDEGDEFALCQWAGIPLELIQGSYFSFPIAARLDVEFAEKALAQGLRLVP